MTHSSHNQLKYSSPRIVTVDGERHGQRLDNFVAAQMRSVPKALLYKLIRTGQIRVNGRRMKQDYRLKEGDQVRFGPVGIRQSDTRQPGPALRRAAASCPVLMEDDSLLILDKPSGVAVHGGSGLQGGLIEALRLERTDCGYLELAHRLDRATSGVLLLAKTRSALKALQQQLAEAETFRKEYIAMVAGEVTDRRDVTNPLRKINEPGQPRQVVVDREGKPSRSVIQPAKSFDGSTLVNVRLYSGRTHQARVHLCAAGHPIAGDSKYGDPAYNREMRKIGLNRLFLHAAKVTFNHPKTTRRVSVSSVLPVDLSLVVSLMEGMRE